MITEPVASGQWSVASKTQESIAELVEAHAGLARRMAARRAASTPAWIVSRDELEAVALEGLWQAAQSFDPGRGVMFATFATPRIAGAMLDLVRQRRPGGRSGRRPHEFPLPTDRPQENCDLNYLQELQARGNSEIDELIDHLSVRCSLTGRWRTILWLRYAAGCQQGLIGRIVGLSESRVSQSIAQLMDEIRAVCPTRESLDDRTRSGTTPSPDPSTRAVEQPGSSRGP